MLAAAAAASTQAGLRALVGPVAVVRVLRPPAVALSQRQLLEQQTLAAVAAGAVVQAVVPARAALVGLAWSSYPCRPYIILAARPARQR
jgi:hypothetical protein